MVEQQRFFCRETGRYEDALAAYERCLALEPDNARYINDTALILLYHLHRDLDRAETMFRHAIELGQKACDNPFSDDSVREENFGAFTDAMLNLSLLMARDGRFDEAAALCDQLVAAAPDREDARGLRERISVRNTGQPFPDDPAPALPDSKPMMLPTLLLPLFLAAAAAPADKLADARAALDAAAPRRPPRCSPAC